MIGLILSYTNQIFDLDISESQYNASRQGKVEESWIVKCIETRQPGIKFQDSKGINVKILQAIMKVFVAQLLEEAKAIQLEWNESGQLQKEHLYEAKRRIDARQQPVRNLENFL